MRVLSLFNGMGCIWLALDKLGIEVTKRYSSEIDKHAIKVNDHNYPDTVQLGDVTQVRGEDLGEIDLLVGGSPCQGFSLAGKELNFDDPRSKLFFEFVRLLDETLPKYFLLENVGMRKEYEDVITEMLGVPPVVLNSGSFSAQNRKRIYWTNLPVSEFTPTHNTNVEDIIEYGAPEILFDVKGKKFVALEDKYATRSRAGIKCVGGLLGKDCTLWADVGYLRRSFFRQRQRVYCASGKSPALCAAAIDSYFDTLEGRRLLTRNELERLQTVRDGYTAPVSRGQALKMLGNGWTVDVIAHLLDPLTLLNSNPLKC